MKRYTALALAYWFTSDAVLFVARKVQTIDRRLFFACGMLYVLLLWCPFLIVKFVERRPITSLGFRCKSPFRLILWGLGAFALSSILFLVEAWYRVSFLGASLETVTPPISNWSLEILQQLMWIGFPEEIVHRGYMLTRLKEAWGTAPALLISSILFGADHLALGDLLQAIQAGLTGVVYGWVRLKTDSVYPSAIAHILLNLFGTTVARAVLSRTLT